MVLTQGVVLPRREHFAVFGDIFDCHIWGRRLLPASRRLRTGMLLNILECKVQSPQPRIIQSKVSGVPQLISPTEGRSSAIQSADRWRFPGGPVLKNPPPVQGARDRSSTPGRKDPLEEGAAAHSSVLACRAHGWGSLAGCRPGLTENWTRLSDWAPKNACVYAQLARCVTHRKLVQCCEPTLLQ